MKSHVVNLDRSPERLARMRRLFADLGLAFERIAAVDGDGLALAGEAAASRHRSSLSAGEIGCFMSHVLCWQAIADGADAYGAVFEDDLHLSKSLPRFLGDSNWIPADAELIKIETWGRKVWLDRAGRDVGGGFALKRLRGSHLGGAGYILSRTAARRLIGATTSFQDPADEMLFNPFFGNHRWLRPLQMVPALCIQDENLQGGSEPFLASMLDGERSLPHSVERRSLPAKSKRLASKLGRWARGQQRVAVPFDLPPK